MNLLVKKAVKDYFKSRHGEIIYPSDVADALNLDYTEVVIAIQALERENKVEQVAP